MSFLVPIAAGIIAPLTLIILASIPDKKDRSQKEEQTEGETEDNGREVRQIIFDAYKQLRKRTPALDDLTACLSQREVPANVAVRALENTVARIAGRYNTRPLYEAIAKINNL